MNEINWTGITIDNGQCEHPDCPWCARRFLAWYKARMSQMHTHLRGADTSFAEAAATSNIPRGEGK
jgi:hypothetical protein